MKILILSIVLLSFIQNIYAGDCPSFAGNYQKVNCSRFLLGKVTPADLITEIKFSNRFKISQNKCNTITVDGNTDYWSMEPKIYLQSTYDLGADIDIQATHVGPNFLHVNYITTDGRGMSINVEKYDVTLIKNSNKSLKMKIKVQYKNLLTAGFWKLGSDIDCDLK